MKKVVLTFGFIGGAMLSAMMLITQLFRDSIDMSTGEVIGYTTMVLAFLMVFFGIKSYRDNVANGAMSFGKALVVGLSIVTIASACYVATWEAIYYKISPDFGEKYAAAQLEKARTAGASEAELAKQKEKMEQFAESYKNPVVNVALTFLEPLPVGLLFAFGSAFVLTRRRRKATPVAA